MKPLKTFLKETKLVHTDEYGNAFVLSEAFHEKLQGVLDGHGSAPHKFKTFLKTARTMLENGEETGLLDSKPKKGSSRAVFFPKEGKDIHIDGKPAKMSTAVKIAFPGQLDKHTGEHQLLGEMQNQTESDHFVSNSYGVLLHTPEKGEHHYQYQEGGILAPVVERHPDDHYLEMGKVSKATAPAIREATKEPGFPKGLSHAEIHDAVCHEYSQAHGGMHVHGVDDKFKDTRENTKEHPFVSELIDMVSMAGQHPGDFHPGNMGIWEHPHTGKKHLVVSDYGFSENVMKSYQQARRNLMNKAWGY